jgi:Trk K+ transport system NAD-binding subunit
MMTLLKLRQGMVELVEEKIAETSVVNGKAIKDIDWPPQCTLAAVIRKGDVIAPNGSTVLQAYDEVLAVLRTSERAALARLLGRS